MAYLAETTGSRQQGVGQTAGEREFYYPEEHVLDLKKIIAKTSLEPRPYQIRIVNRVYNNLANIGMKSNLIEAPTGSGKTCMALLAARTISNHMKRKEGKPFVWGWVAMRRNLLAQVQRENIEKNINANIVPISLFDKNPPACDGLIHDECQHDATDSAVHIHSVIRPRLVLGMTATPFRTDSAKLCFDSVIKDAGIGKLIEEGWLSQYDHYTIPQHNPDFTAKLYLREREKWGKSLMFFHRVEQCVEAAERLRAGGVRVEVVTGETRREEQLERFENNEVDVIINCMILTEGFDCPSLKTVFCRDSCKSVTMQMSGRLFRKYEGYPTKNLVQSKRSKWPFIKTALPVAQYTLMDDESWGALTISPHINLLNCKMIVTLGSITTEMPKYLLERQKGKKRRRTFGG